IHAGKHAAEALEDNLIDEAATVVTHVENHSLFANLREILLDEGVQPGRAHVGQVDISNAASAGLLHLAPVGLNPVQFVQADLVGNRPHYYIVGALHRGFAVDRQRHRLVDGVDEQLVRVLRDPQLTAVDGQQVVAFFDQYSRLGQWRTQISVPVLARIDLGDPVHSAAGVGSKVGAQQSNIDPVDLGIVSPTYISMGVGKLSNHFPKDVGQAQTISHIGQELRVFVALLFPVDAIH